MADEIKSAADGVSHYDLGDGIEACDIIDAFCDLDTDYWFSNGRQFYLAQCLKYLLRLGRKSSTRGDTIKAFDNWYRWWYGDWPTENPFK